MTELGITQEDAAKICSVTQAQISLVLAGVHKSASVRQKIITYIKALESKLSKLNNS
jgi:predicted transcriptional regulator